MCYLVKNSFVAPSNLQLISQGENISVRALRGRGHSQTLTAIDSESNLSFHALTFSFYQSPCAYLSFPTLLAS